MNCHMRKKNLFNIFSVSLIIQQERITNDKKKDKEIEINACTEVERCV